MAPPGHLSRQLKQDCWPQYAHTANRFHGRVERELEARWFLFDSDSDSKCESECDFVRLDSMLSIPFDSIRSQSNERTNEHTNK